MLHHELNVGPNGVIEQISRLILGAIHRRLDGLEQSADVAGNLGMLEGGRHRPAALVAQHQHQGSAQLLRRIFDAAQDRVIQNVARHPYHEQIAQTLIEDDFGGNPGIGTPQDDGKGMLANGNHPHPAA